VNLTFQLFARFELLYGGLPPELLVEWMRFQHWAVGGFEELLPLQYFLLVGSGFYFFHGPIVLIQQTTRSIHLVRDLSIFIIFLFCLTVLKVALRVHCLEALDDILVDALNDCVFLLRIIFVLLEQMKPLSCTFLQLGFNF
jgi:hypothetical protein